jgi:two-component system response regulator FlrC
VRAYLRGILKDSTPADGGTFFLDEISDLKPELEREALQRALALAGGNRRAAAERLGIGLRTLYDKLKRYGLD